MRIGNVIRVPGGDLWIVTEVHDKTIEAVSFDMENVSAIQRLDDSIHKERCGCGYDSDCEDCHGIGHFDKKVIGWKRSKVIAPCVKDFIMCRAAKIFDI